MQEGVNMWGDQKVSCVLLCVLYTVSTLFCMALHSRAIQSSVQELTGDPIGNT
ncbi:unnamed protein product, partial [Staurois parvus]